ncbi:hypothetical protein O3M35_002582 [Rhynocoris fuscipes]|uniref:Uncharacterized protein n=1 Tax=Rhynocoris fuscipes TaxID=488301 RepID=A0AAW1CM15_9HEMI
MLMHEESSHLISKAENEGRKILAGVFYGVAGYGILGFILNTLRELITNFRKKYLIMKIWIPWSRENNWMHVLANAVITIMSTSSLTIFVGYVYLQITFTLYVTTYIKTLQNNVINKGIRNEVYEQHKFILQLITDYNEILSGGFYMETLATPLVPCGVAFALLRAIEKREFGEAIDKCIKAIIGITVTVIACYTGQTITDELEKLHEATYMSNWYKEEPKFRKDWLLMMTRTTNQTTLNYRLFIKFDHVTLATKNQLIHFGLILDKIIQ